MKKLLAIIILCSYFITPLQANDIRDFQIEGISLRDKLTDHLSIEEIKKNSKDYYDKKNFIPVQIKASKLNSNVYDKIEFNIKTNDKEYIIHSLAGIIFFDDINKCYIEQKKIFDNDLKNLFGETPGIIVHDFEKKVHFGDKTRKSTFKTGKYVFPSLDSIVIDCNHYSKEFIKEVKPQNIEKPHEMYIAIDSKEFYQFLASGPYK